MTIVGSAKSARPMKSSRKGIASHIEHTLREDTIRALDHLLSTTSQQLPSAALNYAREVKFVGDGGVYFPSPLKQTEAVAALKAVEASVAAAIADLRYEFSQQRNITIDLEKAACFLFSTYLATIDGKEKGNPEAKSLLKDTDLLAAQSILYRRLAANLYSTARRGEYFHLHGSLEATIALNMVGLEGYREDLTDYRECIDTIESHVSRFTCEELEKMNAEKGQAGVTCLKWSDFQETEHGKTMLAVPPLEVKSTEKITLPVPFPSPRTSNPSRPPQILAGIEVLELCRIIAGPCIGRTLAEYGATVLKVTSSKLPDVPFFQVDGNMGKHCTDLDLKSTLGRSRFEELLSTADVLLDGYRPGALTKLGYGPDHLTKLALSRGKGFVYVSENCFGHEGPWMHRPGWQQIADCASGVAWEQGKFMGLDEPVVPPFPMSDYGTGCMGTIAALSGLYIERHKEAAGLYPESVQEDMRRRHNKDFFDLRHADSVDEVGSRALASIKRLHPELFDDKNFFKSMAKGFGGHEIKAVKSPVEIGGTWNGFLRTSRWNGFDNPAWGEWEIESAVINSQA